MKKEFLNTYGDELLNRSKQIKEKPQIAYTKENMTETAVDWLHNCMPTELLEDIYIQAIFKQAKEMEEKHIIDAHTQGYIIGGGNGDLYECKDYYNETFKKQIRK
jgi:hypothetical protein